MQFALQIFLEVSLPIFSSSLYTSVFFCILCTLDALMQFKRLIKRFHEAQKIIMVSDDVVKGKTLKSLESSSAAIMQSYRKNLHLCSVIILNLVLVSFPFLFLFCFSNSSQAIVISIHVNWNLFYCFSAKSANLFTRNSLQMFFEASLIKHELHYIECLAVLLHTHRKAQIKLSKISLLALDCK